MKRSIQVSYANIMKWENNPWNPNQRNLYVFINEQNERKIASSNGF